MRLAAGDFLLNGKPRPGMFVGLFTGKGEMILPRPVSICDYDAEKNALRLVYQVVGKGTSALAALNENDKIFAEGPLGNGYEICETKGTHYLIGGGLGIPPLLFLSKMIRAEKKNKTIALLGYRSGSYMADEFKQYCGEVFIATENGSEGFHGNAVALLEKTVREAGSVNGGCVYACGPKGMLKALQESTEIKEFPLAFSLEERIACGVGACLGCAVWVSENGAGTYKRVCKDGPVFDGRRAVI